MISVCMGCPVLQLQKMTMGGCVSEGDAECSTVDPGASYTPNASGSSSVTGQMITTTSM